MAQRLFLTDARTGWRWPSPRCWSVAAGLTFAYIPGWQANIVAALILLAGSVMPYVFFTRNLVFSFITPFSAAWLSVVTAAAYEHLVVRRALRRAEAERVRYQQSLHFVTHEMRTPLTAIQGSSELIRPLWQHARGEAQADGAAHQLRIQAPGAHDRDVSERGAALGRTDGTASKESFEVGDLMSTLRRSRAPAGRAQADPHPHGSAANTSAWPATAS